MHFRGPLALGRALARTGIMAKLAYIVAGATLLGMVALARTLARSGEPDAVVRVPLVASNLLAWGAGVLLTFAASVRALRRDREEGVRALVRVRGHSATEYLWGRVLGLGIELLWLVGGGSVLAGAVAGLLATGRGTLAHALAATGAALAFSFAFSAVLAPVAMATLGTRSRMGGYLVLVFVLVMPELLQPWTAHILPAGWEELGSIPGALLAVRAALLPSHVDIGLLARASAMLALVTAVALFAVRAELAALDAEPPVARKARA
jgi:hypothetical protein